MRYPILTADEAAALIRHGECLGVSGVAQAGALKAIPAALARKAKEEHEAGREFQVSWMSGASTSLLADGVLAEADAISRVMPYQAVPAMRQRINEGRIAYNDYHLSQLAQAMRYGTLPRVTTAIIEVCAVSDEGELTLTTSAGNSATYCELADRIILELNSYHKPELRELHDTYSIDDPPRRCPIPLMRADERLGSQTVKVDPAKIAGVVLTHEPDHSPRFKELTPQTERIGAHVVHFLEQEYQSGRLPGGLPPLQSGVGNIANAVLAGLERSTIIPPFEMYTEVIQDSVISLMYAGRCLFASGCALTVSDEVLSDIYEHFDFFRDKILLRPAEISNNPGLARRLGLICMNTAIEADIFGNVNSTHLFGNNIMNGIGGSCGFARSAAVTIFTCPSIAKGGAISSIVPMVSHTDQTEHDVDILATEQGIADLRGKCPRERAEIIIENCAHPDYRPLLRRYLALTPTGHTPHCLSKAFCFHTAYLETGDMRHAHLPLQGQGK